MQEYRLAEKTDFENLKKLWKICFNADEQFLTLYFSKGIVLTRTYILSERNDIASALSIFEIGFNGQRGGYVYGVCTHPKYRGNAYALKLLQYAESQENKTGHKFFITRPATPNLFGYYMKAGYTVPVYRSETELKPEGVNFNLSQKRIDGTDLFVLRNAYLTDNYFLWGIKECDYIIEYIKYCNGDSIRLGENKYLIGYNEDKKYLVLESNADNDTLRNFVKQYHQECESLIIFSRMMVENKKLFALYKPTGNVSIPDTESLLSFSME